MKFLIINSWTHPKNKIGLENILKYLNIEYKYGNQNDIDNYDIIYESSFSIDTSNYKNKKFIFGPHFSVFPNYKLNQINNIHNNSVYILTAEWWVSIWNNMIQNNLLPLKCFQFPVDTNKFNEIKPLDERKEVFVYYKRRNPNELLLVENFLKNKNIKYKLFNYVAGYNEQDYINSLHDSKYGIWIDAHETQGFALEEALSCNVPLLVWNISSMNQEYGSSYSNIPATTIPYWDNKCGEYFYDDKEFEDTYNKFINNLSVYKPRDYILNTLDTKQCAEQFKNIIDSFNNK